MAYASPVQPELTSPAWEQTHLPVCAYDGRAWAGPKADQIVSCSGPAEYFADGPFATYGYCAYHWALRQEGKLLNGAVTPNPTYTDGDRRRDQDRIKSYWDGQHHTGLPDNMRG